MNRTTLLTILTSLLSLNLFSGVITTIEELDEAALFRFSIMSDNKGKAPSNSSHMDRCANWVQGSEFILGLGDHLVGSSGDPFIDFIRNDPMWNTKFYPNIADGENQALGSGQSDWGGGAGLFNYVNNFWGRPNVQNQGNNVDYYCWFENSGFTIHVIQLHFSDSGPFEGEFATKRPQKFQKMPLFDTV